MKRRDRWTKYRGKGTKKEGRAAGDDEGLKKKGTQKMGEGLTEVNIEGEKEMKDTRQKIMVL